MVQKYSLLKDIETRITELGTTATYKDVQITGHRASQASVGLWWFARGRVLAYPELPENCEPGEQVCTNKEHSRIWAYMQKRYAEQLPELLEVNYNQVERGRVWFIPDKPLSNTGSYLITCSTTISKNLEAQAEIKTEFGISDKRVRVEAQPALYDREIKIK